MAIEFEHFSQGGHKDESHVSEQMPSDKGRTGGTAKGGISHTYSKTSHTFSTLTVSCSKGRLQQNPFPLLCITMNEQYLVYQRSMMRDHKYNSSSE